MTVDEQELVLVLNRADAADGLTRAEPTIGCETCGLYHARRLRLERQRG